jgi:two-component system, LuxR family, sensor kinase FixL
MTWITILWPMVTATCITMALIHLWIGLRRSLGTQHLLFSLNAFIVAVFSCLELASTRVESPAQFLELERWLDFLGGRGACVVDGICVGVPRHR